MRIRFYHPGIWDLAVPIVLIVIALVHLVNLIRLSLEWGRGGMRSASARIRERL